MFVAHEMPTTFIADLNALVDAVETAIRTRDARNGARTAARTQFETTLATGMEAVRKLDVLIRNRCKHDPVTLAVWERDRRVEYPYRSKAPSTLPVVTPVAATPAVNPTLAVSSTEAVPDAEAA